MMKPTPIRLLAATALVTALALAGCKREEAAPASPPPPAAPAPAPAPPPAPMPATASVTGVTLGNAIGADMMIAAPMTAFATTDTIHAAIATATSEPMATVNGSLSTKWSFEDGQVVNEETRDIVFTGNGITAFQISKSDGWPVGKYTLEVKLNDAVVQSVPFEVK